MEEARWQRKIGDSRQWIETSSAKLPSKGGKAAHQKGTAHEWTSEQAREAGRKGGFASHRPTYEPFTEPTGIAEVEPTMAGTGTES